MRSGRLGEAPAASYSNSICSPTTGRGQRQIVFPADWIYGQRTLIQARPLKRGLRLAWHTSKVGDIRTVWPDPPPAEDVTAEYVDSALRTQGRPGTRDHVWSTVLDRVAPDYSTICPDAELVEFEDGPAKFLFDLHGGSRAERTVVVVAQPQRPTEGRDSGYQAGYPLSEHRGARPVDRGHFVPYSGGGQFGPNIFAQDRALNRGWSRQGRLYRALETRAVAAHDAVLMARPHYVDNSDVPAMLDLGVGDEHGWEVRRFLNRYDLPVGPEQVELAVLLNGATGAQIGALGEETAATFLVDELGVTLVTTGDAGMPRDGAAQDLDIVAVMDGSLIAFEVKTQFQALTAGRHTRAGNLGQPRMRRPRPHGTVRQGSKGYVAQRLEGTIDVHSGYAGIEVRAIAVDFRLMELQQFALNDSGTRLSPLGPPADCTSAAQTALATIMGHRGFL